MDFELEQDNYSLRGFYRPSFFSLFINGEFREDFEDITEKDLGTFVHEYIHYLQNITTILGLQSSTFYFTYLFEVRKYIAENQELILPLVNIPFSEKIVNAQNRFSLCNGSTNYITPQYDKINIKIKRQTLGNVSINSVFVEFYLEGVLANEIIFGNNCVKESMAILFQQLFDNEAISYTIPYHSVELLCKELNPELLKDKRKLITLCLISLNSQNCGLTLYELLRKSREDHELNGIELYQKYLNELTVEQSGKSITIKNFLIESIDRFKKHLTASVESELKHFAHLLDNIKLSAQKDILPIIDILYTHRSNNINMLEALIDYYGIPHIRTVSGYNYFPVDQESNQPSLEYVVLIGQRIVLDRLLGINRDQLGDLCSLKPQCELSNSLIIDENCFETQWKRTIPCTFKIVSDYWQLPEKIAAGNTA